MKDKIKAAIKESIAVKEKLLTAEALKTMEDIAREIIGAVKNDNKVIIFGNGGSAADAQHMAAELVGRFKKDRRALPAIALTTDTSAMTAISNDYGYEASFSRQLEALGRKGDVAIGISTSGNAKNVIKAMELAKAKGIRTVALTGRDGGAIKKIADIAFIVPSSDTARIQESHITVIHAVCELVEDGLF